MKPPSDSDVRLLHAAADSTRLAMLRQLSTGSPVCACELTSGTDISQPTVSHHLKVLRKAGWINGERRGTWNWYSLRPEAVALRDLAFSLEPAEPLPAVALRSALRQVPDREPVF